jgi:hypothetical protein
MPLAAWSQLSRIQLYLTGTVHSGTGRTLANFEEKILLSKSAAA